MKIAENISWKALEDKVVAVNITTGVYFTMNIVASEIWQAIGENKTEEEILETLMKSYPHISPETIKNDYQEQIEYWKNEELIIL